jgi:hypothetical protein
MASPRADGRDAAATIASPRAAVVVQDRDSPLAPLDRAQGALPSPLRTIPLPAMLAVAGLAAVSALVPAMVLWRSDKVIASLEDEAPASSVSAPIARLPAAPSVKAQARLTAAELEEARASGVDALTTLARRFPDDPGVLQALGTALVRERKDGAGAVRTLRRLLEVAPDTKGDREVQQALLELANGPPEVAADAFEVLRTRMGALGPDLVFELAQNATGKYAKEHAANALDDPALMKAASRALLVADDLRRRAPCARRGMMARVASEGDGRSVPFLRQMIATKPCGGLTAIFRGADCPVHTCITSQDRSAVGAAIATIEKRDTASVDVRPPGSPSAKAPASIAPAPAPAPSTASPGGGAGLR